MKLLKYILVLLVVLISWTVHIKAQTLNSSVIESEVAKVFNAYVDQTNSTGLDGIETYFSDDERFYWVEDGRIQYPTKEAMVKGIQEFFPTVESLNLKILEKNIDAINENTAALYAEYSQDIVLKSGYEFTLDGAMTILLIWKNGEWKFLNGHSSVKKPRGNG